MSIWQRLPGKDPLSFSFIHRHFLSTYCIVVVQSVSHVWLFVTPWTVAHQASLSFTISQSLLKLMSIESMMLSNHLVLCYPLLLLPSIFPSIRIFSNESAVCIRWPKNWSFSLSISPSREYSGWFPLQLTGLISLLSKGLYRVFSSATIQNHQFFGAQPSWWSSSRICNDYWKNHNFDYTEVCKQSDLWLLICCLGLSWLFSPRSKCLLISIFQLNTGNVRVNWIE